MFTLPSFVSQNCVTSKGLTLWLFLLDCENDKIDPMIGSYLYLSKNIVFQRLNIYVIFPWNIRTVSVSSIFSKKIIPQKKQKKNRIFFFTQREIEVCFQRTIHFIFLCKCKYEWTKRVIENRKQNILFRKVMTAKGIEPFSNHTSYKF